MLKPEMDFVGMSRGEGRRDSCVRSTGLEGTELGLKSIGRFLRTEEEFDHGIH